MAKRNLGLGKVKSKKQKTASENPAKEQSKTNSSNDNSNEQLLTVELENEVNPDDPLSQLCGLWDTWKNGERDNELILNGIINECDRILRNCVENGGKEEIKLNDQLYSIYAQSLSDIAKFKPENEVKEWLDNSLERVDDGFTKFGENNIRLKFTKCGIILNKIAIEFVGRMTLDSTKEEFQGLKELFTEFTRTWEEAVKECDRKKDYALFQEEWILEILNIFDDLLDIIDKFGKQINEDVDSDEEEEAEKEAEERVHKIAEGGKLEDVLQEEDLNISENHPLYEIQTDDSYNKFWRDNMEKYKESMDHDNIDQKIKKSVYEKLGQSYLMEAEDPIAFFNSYQYDREEDEDDQADTEILQLAEKARTEALKLVGQAVQYLRHANDDEDPKSWVNIAEALITYGNLLELESTEQEQSYKEAEKLLRRANNATHGHYEDILNSLIN